MTLLKEFVKLVVFCVLIVGISCFWGGESGFGQAEPSDDGISVEVVICITNMANYWRHIYSWESVLGPKDALTLLVASTILSKVDETLPHLRTAPFKRQALGFNVSVTRDPIAAQYLARNELSKLSRADLIWHFREESMVTPSLSILPTNCVDRVNTCLFLPPSTACFIRSYEVDFFLTPTKKFIEGEVYFGPDRFGDKLFTELSKQHLRAITITDDVPMWASTQSINLNLTISLETNSSSSSNDAVLLSECFEGKFDERDIWEYSATFCSSYSAKDQVRAAGNEEKPTESATVEPSVLGTSPYWINNCVWRTFRAVGHHLDEKQMLIRGSFSSATKDMLTTELLQRNKIFGRRGVSRPLRATEHLKLHLDNISAVIDNAGNANNSSWQKEVNIYAIHMSRSAMYTTELMKYLQEKFSLDTTNLFVVDESWDDIPADAAELMAHLSALVHLSKSNQSFGLVLNDGFVFDRWDIPSQRDSNRRSRVDDINNYLEDSFYWASEMFDVIFLSQSMKDRHVEPAIATAPIAENATGTSSTPTQAAHPHHKQQQQQHSKPHMRYLPNHLHVDLTPGAPMVQFFEVGYIVTKSFAQQLLRSFVTVLSKVWMDYPRHLNIIGEEFASQCLSSGSSASTSSGNHVQQPARAYLLDAAITSFAPHDSHAASPAAVDQESIASNKLIYLVQREAPSFLGSSDGPQQQQTPSKLLIVSLEGNLGNQLFSVFTTLRFLVLHSYYDFKLTIPTTAQPSHAATTSRYRTNIFGMIPDHRIYNMSNAVNVCQQQTCTQFDHLFQRYLNDSTSTVSTASSTEPIGKFVTSLKGNKCKVSKVGYRLGDPLASLNSTVVAFSGHFRSFRPLLPFRTEIYQLILNSTSAENLDYLQMILGNIYRLAMERPIVFVAADDWEGTYSSSVSNDEEGEESKESIASMSRLYLQSAMNSVNRHYHPVSPFFVFFAKNVSNAQSSFGSLPNSCFIDFGTMSDTFSLLLMSSMDAGIASTSLFSRWAAFLLESRQSINAAHFIKPYLLESTVIIAPRLLSREEELPNMYHDVPRSASQHAIWGCLYLPTWVLI